MSRSLVGKAPRPADSQGAQDLWGSRRSIRSEKLCIDPIRRVVDRPAAPRPAFFEHEPGVNEPCPRQFLKRGEPRLAPGAVKREVATNPDDQAVANSFQRLAQMAQPFDLKPIVEEHAVGALEVLR